jgi:hypothetical protein
MLNHPILKLSLTALVGMALSLTAFSESIQDWPTRDGINLEPAKQRFIEVFSGEPESLNHLVKGFEDCQLDTDKAAKLSHVHKEAILGPYASSENVEAEVDLDINELTVSSSVAGCAALRQEILELVPAAKFKQYQVRAGFKHGFLIYADYETDLEMVIKIEGADDHKSQTRTQTISHVFHAHAKLALDQAYPKEMYSLVDMKTGGMDIKSYSFIQSPQQTPKEGISHITLSRTHTKDKVENSLNIVGKQNGLDQLEMIGNHTLIRMLDSKMHGLTISENFFAATDKTKPPYMLACYDMGQKFNVFKKLSDNTCIKIDESQIGMPDVYVDQLYQMQLDSKNRMAELQRKAAERLEAREVNNKTGSRSMHVSKSLDQLVAREQAATKEKEQAFAKKQKQAKCKLKNDNWVYLGTNCKNGLANGTGNAVDRQGLRFEGDFKAGYRSKGDIHQDGQMIFSGDLKSGKPDGSAICLFEGEYEECRFFRGKRIDTLYKIRKENAKNLAKMEELQKENAMTASYGGNNNDGGSNVMVDALEKEATKRAASFIFDQLF